jgi:rhamnosyltransferase
VTVVATVAILTFNGERYIRQILSALVGQDFDGGIEILVVDSGSTDATLAIVAEFPQVRLHEIPNSAFGHGKTRNLAAQLAMGEYVAFLTHDAIPASADWLTELIEPMRRFPDVVAVLGKQEPRPDCIPIMKYEIRRAFATQGPDFATTISYLTPALERESQLFERAAIYSDVNSATRRDFLADTLPYRDVAYSEDQLFGRDVLRSGRAKAYAARGTVIHSNDLTYSEYRKRLFDEIVGMRRAGAELAPAQRGYRAFARAVVLDPIEILRDRDYSVGRKFFWLFVNPFYHLVKYRVGRKARRFDLADDAAFARASLEARRKAQAAEDR